MISHGFGPFQGPSPWMDKPVLSEIRWRGCLEKTLHINIGFSGLLLLKKWCGQELEERLLSSQIMTSQILLFVSEGGETTISMWEWFRLQHTFVVYLVCLTFLTSMIWLLLDITTTLDLLYLEEIVRIGSNFWLFIVVCTLGFCFVYVIPSLSTPATERI